jgi:hypothetical protein
MDLAALLNKLWEVSPILAICSIIVYVLWTSNQKKDATILETVKSHADDRKETQNKILDIVTQNSASNLQLSGAVENLTASNKDVVNRLINVEQKVEKNGRAQRITTVKTS